MIIKANTIIKICDPSYHNLMPQTMNRKQIIMPIHMKVRSIYLLKAAVIVNFRVFQLLDFPKTLKKQT